MGGIWSGYAVIEADLLIDSVHIQPHKARAEERACAINDRRPKRARVVAVEIRQVDGPQDAHSTGSADTPEQKLWAVLEPHLEALTDEQLETACRRAEALLAERRAATCGAYVDGFGYCPSPLPCAAHPGADKA
jgi:hypothetical protein